MAASTLLWIHQDGPARPKTYELSCNVRQHVMVDYHTKNAKREMRGAGKSKLHNRQSRNGNTSVAPIAVDPSDVSSLERTFTPLRVAYCPPSTPGLVTHEHNSIYNAIWWHRYAPFGAPKEDRMDWKQKYRLHASELLWDLAKEDKTFFEIFMCFTAAKEIAVKGSKDLRPYFRHKGRAISRVSQDVNREGTLLRVNAIAAISLLNRMAFAEQEYEAADQHIRALQKLTAQRFRQVPSFCWLTLVWSDLHMTAVQLRAPYLEYYIHQEYRQRPFSGKFLFDAQTYFSNIIPDELVVSSHFRAVATRLYQALRECGYAYDQKDVFWKISRGMSYEIAYLLAETQVDIDKSGSLEEKLILIGCQMQFWGMLNAFAPQSGLQRFQMSRLSCLLAPIHPSTLCTRWLEHTGSLDLLLWCLCNAAGSALYQPHNSTRLTPAWLQRYVAYIIDLLGVVSPYDLEARLHNLPSSKAWNGPAYQSFFLGMQTHDDSATSTESKPEPHVEIFRDLRLIFDWCPSSPPSE